MDNRNNLFGTYIDNNTFSIVLNSVLRYFDVRYYCILYLKSNISIRCTVYFISVKIKLERVFDL